MCESQAVPEYWKKWECCCTQQLLQPWSVTGIGSRLESRIAVPFIIMGITVSWLALITHLSLGLAILCDKTILLKCARNRHIGYELPPWLQMLTEQQMEISEALLVFGMILYIRLCYSKYTSPLIWYLWSASTVVAFLCIWSEYSTSCKWNALYYICSNIHYSLQELSIAIICLLSFAVAVLSKELYNCDFAEKPSHTHQPKPLSCLTHLPTVWTSKSVRKSKLCFAGALRSWYYPAFKKHFSWKVKVSAHWCTDYAWHIPSCKTVRSHWLDVKSSVEVKYYIAPTSLDRQTSRSQYLAWKEDFLY